MNKQTEYSYLDFIFGFIKKIKQYFQTITSCSIIFITVFSSEEKELN
jgi:hypothetical protein